MSTDEVMREYGTFMWWSILLRGIFGVLFGIVSLVWPDITVWALVFVFGIYAIADGIAGVLRAIGDRKTISTWVWWLAMSAASIVAGIVALVWPAITALALLYVIAFYAILFGVMCVMAALRAKHLPGTGWGWLLAGGIAGVVFGLLLLAFPGSGILSIIWLVGWYAIVFGAMLVVAALQFRSHARKLGLV